MKKKNYKVYVKDRPPLVLVVGTKAEMIAGHLTIYDGENEVAAFLAGEYQGWTSEERVG